MESTRIEGYVDERNLKSHTETPEVTGVYLWPGPGNPEYPVRRGLLLISSDGSMPRVFTEGEVKALVQEILDSNGPIYEGGPQAGSWPSAYLHREDIESIAAKHGITL